jgi:hypothetical protein
MTEVERTSAGLQTVIPGCELRTLPRSTTRVGGRPRFASILQTFQPSRTTRKASRCGFASETRAKSLAERIVRLIVADYRCGRRNNRTTAPSILTMINRPIRRDIPPHPHPARYSIMPHLNFFGQSYDRQSCIFVGHTLDDVSDR